MSTKRHLYRVSKDDSIEDAIDKNEALIGKIVKLEREIKNLKSQNSTLAKAWKHTEEYLLAISEDKTLEQIFDEIARKTNISKTDKMCYKCKIKMNKKKFDGFEIISCSKCGYRNKINEKKSSKAEKN